MFTHLKSTMRCMLMHLSSGHVTCCKENSNPLNFSPDWTYGAALSHVELCFIFLVLFVTL